MWEKPFEYDTNIAGNRVFKEFFKVGKANSKMQNCEKLLFIATRNQIGRLNEKEECNSKTKKGMVISLKMMIRITQFVRQSIRKK